MSNQIDNKVQSPGSSFSWTTIRQAALGPMILPIAIVLLQYNILIGNFKIITESWDLIWVSVTASTAVYLSLCWILRNANKAALTTLAAIVLFFDVSLMLCVKKAIPAVDATALTFGMSLIPTGCALYVVLARRDLTTLRRIISGSCVFLLLVQLQINTFRNLFFRMVVLPRAHSQLDNTAMDEVSIKTTSTAMKPDIYYMIVDSMPSQTVIEQVYNYHDKTFDNFLKARGFYVAEKSHSNYPITMMSLPSSLNMTLWREIARLMDADDYAHNMVAFMIRHARVTHLLQSHGYTFVNVGSGMGPTNFIPEAQVNARSSFWNEQFAPTMAGTLLGWPNNYKYLRDYLRQVRLDCFAKFAESRFEPSPKFVFSHIILPHIPCLFDANGNPVDGMVTYNQGSAEKELFLNQVIFCRKKIMEAIDLVLSKPGPKPVIIVQGDHGSSALGNCELPSKTWSNELINERFGILNAYYIPNQEDIGLYPTITPVNSFRIIFNHYLHTNIPLEKDRSFATDWGHPFVFREVTDILSNPPDESKFAGSTKEGGVSAQPAKSSKPGFNLDIQQMD